MSGEGYQISRVYQGKSHHGLTNSGHSGDLNRKLHPAHLPWLKPSFCELWEFQQMAGVDVYKARHLATICHHILGDTTCGQDWDWKHGACWIAPNVSGSWLDICRSNDTMFLLFLGPLFGGPPNKDWSDIKLLESRTRHGHCPLSANQEAWDFSIWVCPNATQSFRECSVPSQLANKTC